MGTSHILHDFCELQTNILMLSFKRQALESTAGRRGSQSLADGLCYLHVKIMVSAWDASAANISNSARAFDFETWQQYFKKLWS